MKKLLILVYIAVVATLSVTARAEEIKLVVTSSSIDSDLQVLKVQGHFPTPCVQQTEFRAKMVGPKTVEVSFVGQKSSNICIQIVGAPMTLAIDAASIKHNLLREAIELNGNYRVISKQAGIDTKFDFTNIMPHPFATTAISGKIVLVRGGFAIEADEKQIALISPFFDIGLHVGETIQVIGHIDNGGLVGGDVFRTKKSDSKFIVTGFRLIAQD